MTSFLRLTTRRGFIAGSGFGAVSLYGLWVAYGAAPAPWALIGRRHAENDDPHRDGHADHGAAGVTVEEFRRLTAAFVERYAMPDGSVYPRMPEGEADARATGSHGHGSDTSAGSDGHGHAAPMAHGTSVTSEGQHHAVMHADAQPRDVYLIAEKWFYEPAHLRLDLGVTYRFRMMATDVSHGASIQFGRGSRMIRLRPGRPVEMEVRFVQPGRHLVYCAVYCGEAHDFMQGRIDVA